MIDKKIFIENPSIIKKALENRNCKINFEGIIHLINEQSIIKKEIDKLNEQRNNLSNKFGELIKSKDLATLDKLKQEVLNIKLKIDKFSENENKINEQLNEILYSIPNIPHSSVPVGKDENDNVEIKRFSSPTKFNFKIKPHWDIAIEKDLACFEQATKISGSRFVVYKNKGAKLIRALQQYTLDFNVKNGYEEFAMPVIVNGLSLFRTGQLPKFENDLFKLTDSNYYLSPTLEVQLTNFYSDTIFKEEQLPIRITASSLNFRSEAGSAGKDTRGVIRQHQFYKTEMVNIANPLDSYKNLEELTRNAEMILESLNLPYRRIVLCTGDMGFSSSKTYDLEVWMPSYDNFKEISSCSNCESFQARRALMRFKNSQTNKNELVHTLNGSGLAIDRLWAAIIENNQQQDGSIIIPDVLVPYTGFSKI